MTANAIKGRWRPHPILVCVSLCILCLVAGGIKSPGFASSGQIINMLVLSSFLGLIASAQTFVIIGGNSGLDLSVGKMVALSTVLSGIVMNKSESNLIPALIVVLAITFALGCVNGVGVSYFRIPPLVMTLGMSIIIVAIIRYVTRDLEVGGASESLQRMVTARYLGIPSILYLWALYIIAVELLFRNTLFGAKLFAIGANERIAFLSGINVKVFRTLLFGLSGMISGVTGFLYLGYITSVYNTNLGDRLVLPSIIAVAVGGVSLGGGRGNYLGVAAGAFLLQVLESLLVTVNIDPGGRSILFGCLLVGIMLLYGREDRV